MAAPSLRTAVLLLGLVIVAKGAQSREDQYSSYDSAEVWDSLAGRNSDEGYWSEDFDDEEDDWSAAGRTLEDVTQGYGPWNKASLTFFKGFAGGACHCKFPPAGLECDQNKGMGVAMTKSFYEPGKGHGDYDTWTSDGKQKFFGERGKCGVCLEIKCVGCHSFANGHAGCNNGFNGCRSNSSILTVQVLDLLWEGDANRNTVRKHHPDIVSADNDCSDTDYCPKGDGTDYAKRIDMYAPAFEKLADPITGIIKGEWRTVPGEKCTKEKGVSNA